VSEFMGDAIALSSPSGRMSKRARKAALKRLHGKLFPREETKMSLNTIAGEVRETSHPELDNYEIGQRVVARFTNSGRVIQFVGKIVGKTKNYWKIKAITRAYENDPLDRVFHIATLRSRIYSANNCIRCAHENGSFGCTVQE
jgi:hypothetical protein